MMKLLDQRVVQEVAVTDRRYKSQRVPRFVTIMVVFLVVLGGCTGAGGGGIRPIEGSESALRGKGSLSFTYAQLPDQPIELHYYVPESVKPESPIVIVCHGLSRNASDYRDYWVEKARQYGLIVVAPEFTDELYPGSSGYALGNVFLDGNNARQDELNEQSVWTFTAIEPIFDEIKARTNNDSVHYYIFGHSAGAQFVHRLLLMVPDGRYAAAVAANAGWYTVPTETIDYPYGLGLTPASDAPFTFFSQRLVVMIGELDNDPNARNLRQTPEAEQQGPHRYARAHYFFEQSAARAQELGQEFAWEIVDVPSVGHSASRMAPRAADYLFGR